MDALKDSPTVEGPLLTEKGPVYLQKTDIFKKQLWFGYHDESTWHPISVERVNEILALNKKGVKAASLQEDVAELKKEANKDELLKNDLERFDKKNSRKPKNERTDKQRPDKTDRAKTEKVDSPKSERPDKPKKKKKKKPKPKIE
jgi:hypothetical protein